MCVCVCVSMIRNDDWLIEWLIADSDFAHRRSSWLVWFVDAPPPHLRDKRGKRVSLRVPCTVYSYEERRLSSPPIRQVSCARTEHDVLSTRMKNEEWRITRRKIWKPIRTVQHLPPRSHVVNRPAGQQHNSQIKAESWFVAISWLPNGCDHDDDDWRQSRRRKWWANRWFRIK